MIALALREHTALQEFTWVDWYARVAHVQLDAAPSTALDPLRRSLPACSHLQNIVIKTKCGSADAVKTATVAVGRRVEFSTEHWSAVTDEIRRNRCNIQRLDLYVHQRAESNATEAVKTVASAIQMYYNLEHFFLKMENGL
jgi:hypothetical protein